VSVGPFDRLLEYFLEGASALPCIWRENRANESLCVDPRGDVAQCDCWVSSDPEYGFGNIATAGSLCGLLQASRTHRQFRERPALIMRREDCLDCESLALCHGGCPVRAYSVHGDIARKDPDCEVYRILFQHVRQAAAAIALRRAGVAADGRRSESASDPAVYVTTEGMDR